MNLFDVAMSKLFNAADEACSLIYNIYDEALSESEEDTGISFQDPTFDFDYATGEVTIFVELYNEYTDKVKRVCFTSKSPRCEIIEKLKNAYNQLSK